MVKGRVSVVIPDRNERYAAETCRDLLAKAAGDIEIVIVEDGHVDPRLPEDKRLIRIQHGRSKGMRPSINAAVAASTGEYILKADGHTMWSEGYDQVLKEDYLQDNWILTPRRHALIPETWSIDTSQSKYPIDYEALSWPWSHPDNPLTGFHGQAWTSRRDKRKDILLDRDLSSQGSAWFCSRSHWDRRGPMDADRFGFYSESQEVGLSAQLSGGDMMRTKRCWYAHWRKSKAGRGYSLGPNARIGVETMMRWILLDQWPQQTRSFVSLIESFWPVPCWPSDWREQLEKHRQVELKREVAA